MSGHAHSIVYKEKRIIMMLEGHNREDTFASPFHNFANIIY